MGAEAVFHPAVALLVPFPAQGHVTPMLHLARALAAHGVAATVAVPDFIHRRIAGLAPDVVDEDDDAYNSGGSVALASIPSGIAEDGDGDGTPPFGAIAHAMEHHMPAHLERMLLARRRAPVACLVVDVLASWAVPVAERCGVPVAGFWPAMLACYRVVAAIPELMEKGLISESGAPISWNQHDEAEAEEDQMLIRGLEILPAQVELRARELPWLVGDSTAQASRFAFWVQTMHRARSFRWLLVNSFPGEDGGDVTVHQQHPARQQQGPRVLPVRPALLPGSNTSAEHCTKPPKQQQQPVASCGGGKQSQEASMWRADASCIGWLDAQRAGSVLDRADRPDKIRELALGLEAAGRPFLWALKRDPSWRSGLPDGFPERGRGKVVDWAPQEDVLRHAAVGLLPHPLRLELHRGGHPARGPPAFINCAYITGLWQIGLKLGAMSREDVKACIDRVMDGEDGRRLHEKVTALREKVVTHEARGSAERNVRSFVDDIVKEQPLLMQIYNASL
ncbi:hypothetical protein EJB05_38637, partial [Eragrostis curvula]